LLKAELPKRLNISWTYICDRDGLCNTGHLRVLNTAIKYINISKDNLYTAIKSGHLRLVKVIFKKYGLMDIDTYLVRLCMESRHYEVVKMFTVYALNNKEILNRIVLVGTSENMYMMVKYALMSGAYSHVKDDYPLRAACKNKLLPMIKLLLRSSTFTKDTLIKSIRIASNIKCYDIVKLLETKLDACTA
jgi:hypothetical protein